MTLSCANPAAFDLRPGAVIFDTDNTLFSYDEAHEAGLAAVNAKATKTLNLSEAQFEEAFQKARKQIKAQLGGTASSHSRLLYFQRTMELVGLRTQILQSLDFEQTYWRVFLNRARLFDHVVEFLDELRLTKTPTAIVTDLTAQIQFRKIVYFGLDHSFDHVVTSEEAGFDKPNPAPFELAMDKLGDIDGPVWMIGDNAICDIKGARGQYLSCNTAKETSRRS